MKWKLRTNRQRNNMKTEIKRLFQLTHFFRIANQNNEYITYNLKKPSLMLIRNVYKNYLKYIYNKTHKQMPVYLTESYKKLKKPSLYGIVNQDSQELSEQSILKHVLNHCSNLKNENVRLKFILPQQDAMQHFMKWQRYRKYWWSSISTTPGLFMINDIKYQDESANVDIIAKLPCGDQTVEHLSMKFKENDQSSCLCCNMSLENALYIMLLDGLNNSKEEYLRLHRNIAPYKISFALDCKDTDTKETLKELATVLYNKLRSNGISTWLPDFTLSHELQIKDNLHLGTLYTAILSEDTLKNGIFRLMSSSTMLGEQVHVADFHNYAAVIFDK